MLFSSYFVKLRIERVFARYIESEFGASRYFSVCIFLFFSAFDVEQ